VDPRFAKALGANRGEPITVTGVWEDSVKGQSPDGVTGRRKSVVHFQKVKDLSDSSFPCPRQTASRSQQSQVLVNGRPRSANTWSPGSAPVHGSIVSIILTA